MKINCPRCNKEYELVSGSLDDIAQCEACNFKFQVKQGVSVLPSPSASCTNKPKRKFFGMINILFTISIILVLGVVGFLYLQFFCDYETSQKFYSNFDFLHTLTTSSTVNASNNDCGDSCERACSSIIFVFIGMIAFNIFICSWVARDAKSRGMGSSWVFVILFAGLIGLLVYLFSRTNGDLVTCNICNNYKLNFMSRCPHCGN